MECVCSSSFPLPLLVRGEPAREIRVRQHGDHEEQAAGARTKCQNQDATEATRSDSEVSEREVPERVSERRSGTCKIPLFYARGVHTRKSRAV